MGETMDEKDLGEWMDDGWMDKSIKENDLSSDDMGSWVGIVISKSRVELTWNWA